MKSVFQAEPDRTQWLADVVANPRFKEACVFAVAQYARALGSPGDELRMKGAVEILKVLEDLPVKNKPSESQQGLIYPKRQIEH